MAQVLQALSQQQRARRERAQDCEATEQPAIGKNSVGRVPGVDGKAEEAETLRFQKSAYLRKKWLPGVDFLEFDLGVNQCDVGDPRTETLERCELGALDVHPEQVDARDGFGLEERLERHRLDLDFALPVLLEAVAAGCLEERGSPRVRRRVHRVEIDLSGAALGGRLLDQLDAILPPHRGPAGGKRVGIALEGEYPG